MVHRAPGIMMGPLSVRIGYMMITMYLKFLTKGKDMDILKTNYKHYVCTDADWPEKLVKSAKEAVEYDALYIDAFDDNGDHVDAWMMDDGKYINSF